MSEPTVDTLSLRRIKRLLLDSGATPSFADLWCGYARPSLEFRYDGADECDETELGATKLGGVPDLEAGAAWPTRPAYDPKCLTTLSPEIARAPHPLGFLAQINLADVSAAGGCGLILPDRGLLQVFYDTEVQPWGGDFGDRIGTVVRYVKPGSSISRAVVPASAGYEPLVDRVANVRLVSGMSLPHRAWLHAEATESLGWTEDSFYEELDQVDEEVFESLTWPRHVMGGWPALEQSTIEEQCEFVTGGPKRAKMSELSDEQWKTLREKAKSWRQLFQFGGDEDALQWTGGRTDVHLYMMMREHEVATLSFDKAHTVFQCT